MRVDCTSRQGRVRTNQGAIGKSKAWLHELLSDLLAITRPLSELVRSQATCNFRKHTFDTVAQHRRRRTIILPQKMIVHNWQYSALQPLKFNHNYQNITWARTSVQRPNSIKDKGHVVIHCLLQVLTKSTNSLFLMANASTNCKIAFKKQKQFTIVPFSLSFQCSVGKKVFFILKKPSLHFVSKRQTSIAFVQQMATQSLNKI